MRFAAMANIFLLEDDKILSKGISIALKKDEHMVTAVYGYLEALKQYQKQKYDLFLLDINLPDGNGLEFCEKIRETSETPVLFLTANDTEEDMLEGFGVGCDDYISKPFMTRELIIKINKLLRSDIKERNILKAGVYEIHKNRHKVFVNNKEIDISAKEYDLLIYFMDNPNVALSRDNILENIWNNTYEVSHRVVDDTIRRIRKKMPEFQLETIYGYGYVYEKK